MRYDQIPMTRLDFGLDPQLDRRSVWAPPGEPGYSENDAIWIYDQGQGIGVHAWLGHSGTQYPEAFERMTVFLPGDQLLVRAERGRQSAEDAPSGPHMLAKCEIPFERWVYRYEGPLHPATPAELASGPVSPDRETVEVCFEAHARMVAPAFAQGGFYRDRADYLRSPISHFFGGFRIEQALFAEGRLRIGDRWFHIAGPGLRTHRKGSRTMQASDGADVPKYDGHRWAHAVFPSGREFYHCWFGGAEDDQPVGSEAFVRENGVFHRAEVVRPMPMSLAGRGERASFSLRSGLGETLIEAEVAADSFQSLMGTEFFGVQWDSPNPGCLAMSQAFVRYRWGAETAVNMMERSVGLRHLSRPA